MFRELQTGAADEKRATRFYKHVRKKAQGVSHAICNRNKKSNFIAQSTPRHAPNQVARSRSLVEECDER
jgi:hypothetical protein